MSVQVCAFERVLEEGNYEEATSMLWKVQDMADEKQLKEEVVKVLENLVRKQLEREDAKKREAEEGGCTYLLEETSKDREEKRRREVEEIRSQWEDIHLLRELLLRLNKNCTDRESLVHKFTLSMVGRLQLTEMCNLRILAEHHNMQRLQQENLMPLAEVLQAQYISLFRQMTQEIVALVKDVEDNKFQNLEALLQAYRRIG
uniref:Filamin/ABP280 repeat protein n=1 Tax=Toxoplasma gondii TgCATBr9 TaxID=943120 RepID=A0A2T6J3R3_TOXGO|nr:filamin/ABP280 repeat protein [Toxoplasma gondii TgCATBr9]